jgi:hypothetical protein
MGISREEHLSRLSHVGGLPRHARQDTPEAIRAEVDTWGKALAGQAFPHLAPRPNSPAPCPHKPARCGPARMALSA